MLMLAYGYIKANPPQARRSLHAAVLDRRQREGSRDDGGDAGVRRTATRPPASRCIGRQERSCMSSRSMATAGLYDDSGKWLYHTGLPAKSGVGGGIIAVSPGNVRHRRRLAAAR